MKKIVIVDDHNLVRMGLKALISEIEGLEVVAEATNGKELFTILSSIVPDLIILDISMPEMDGIAVLRMFREQNIEHKVLVASMFNEYQYIKTCIDLGANGFIFKDEEDEEYFKAISTIALKGENYFTPKSLRLVKLP